MKQLCDINYTEIVINSTTLAEWLTYSREGITSASHRSSEEIEDLVHRWKKASASGNLAKFQNRLAFENLSLDLIKKKLSFLPELPDNCLCWLRTLDEVAYLCSEILCDLKNNYWWEKKILSDELSIAFPEIYIPFLRLAHQRLISKFENNLAENAQITILKQLLKELSYIGELALYESFDRFRSQDEFEFTSSDNNKKQYYNIFITNLFSNRLIPLFEGYPVLARQLCTITDTFIDFYSELFYRLNNDQIHLSNIFNKNKLLGNINDVMPALSDRHHSGRRVISLSFCSGLKLIYKPRNIDLECAYNQFLDWLKQKEDCFYLPSVKILPREGYGWVEYIANTPCLNKKQIQDYYRRTGILACIIYLLAGSDFHMDNIIATSKGPVLVDVETLLPPLEIFADCKYSNLWNSVKTDDDYNKFTILETGLFFTGMKSMDGSVHDVSGFRGNGGHQSFLKKRTWVNINTDSMYLSYESNISPPMQNLPCLTGTIQFPEHFVDDIIKGFKQFYRFLILNSDEIRLVILNLFDNLPTRIIYRHSNDYAILIHSLVAPRYQRDGLIPSILLEALSRKINDLNKNPYQWDYFLQERESILNLDIPHFTVKSSSNSLIKHFKNFNESDLNKQSKLIQAQLVVFKEKCSHLPKKKVNVQDGNSVTEKKWIHYSNWIAEQILSQAVEESNGKVFWKIPTFEILEGDDNEVINPFLYSGISGITIFLTAYAKISNNNECLDIVDRACQTLYYQIVRFSKQSIADGIGACNGIGSVIYAYVIIAYILENNKYLEMSLEIAKQITPEIIQNDKRYDVEGGSAGCILALLALYRYQKSAILLEGAENCAAYLLRRGKKDVNGIAWINDEGIKQIGYAHGASGIALAFIRLYQVTNNSKYLKAALESIAYERQFFSEHKRNWPVLIKKTNGNIDASHYMLAWCNGAPGIGLARLGGMVIFEKENQALKNELEIALQSIIDADLNYFDHLCCGNFGHVDILLTAGRILGQKKYSESALKRAENIIQRAETKGYFSLRAKIWENKCYQFGFFKGLSGIGYTMLRLIFPKLLPSILFFETF